MHIRLSPIGELELNWNVLHVQGEMDADGGQPEMANGVVDDGRLDVVSWVFGCRVVVVRMLLQLVKPNGFRLVKTVPFEQVPPETKLISCGLSRMSQDKSQRLFKQSIGSVLIKDMEKHLINFELKVFISLLFLLP